jgi:hypothetical protein
MGFIVGCSEGVLRSTQALSFDDVHGPIAGFSVTEVDLADGSGAKLSGKQGQRFSKRGLPILANGGYRPLPKSNLQHFMIVAVS